MHHSFYFIAMCGVLVPSSALRPLALCVHGIRPTGSPALVRGGFGETALRAAAHGRQKCCVEGWGWRVAGAHGQIAKLRFVPGPRPVEGPGIGCVQPFS